MNTAIPPRANRVPRLRRRVSATEAMIRQIDDKLSRLSFARSERITALNHIRCELARALSAEKNATEADHEHAAIH